MMSPTTVALLREAVTCASLAAERADAGDHEVALDLASRAATWVELALCDLRPTSMAKARQ